MTDYHSIGLMANADDDEAVGALVSTPQAILDEMKTVKAMVESLHVAIQEQLRADDSSVRPVFLREWLSFRDEFQSFFNANEGWSSRLWGAAAEKTEDYKRRVIGWQDAFKKEGVKLTGPEFKAPEAFPWKWIAAAGIVIGSVIVLKEASGIVRSFRGEATDG